MWSATVPSKPVILPSASVTLSATSFNLALDATPLITTFSSATSAFSPFAFFNVTLPSPSTSYSPLTTCNSAVLSNLFSPIVVRAAASAFLANSSVTVAASAFLANFSVTSAASAFLPTSVVNASTAV